MLAFLRLQLLNKRRGYSLQNFRSEKKSKVGTVAGYIGFALLAVYLLGLMVWFEVILFDQFAKLGQADAVLAVGFLAFTFFTLIYGFFGLSGQLFFGRDTAFISALPITSRGILAVKTIMIAISEAGMSLLFCAALVVKLGIYRGAGIDFYLKALLGCVFLPIIPLALALLLSFLLIRLSKLWKRREGMTTIFSFVIIVGVMLLSMGSQSMDESKLQTMLLSLVLGQESLTQMLLAHYPPLQWLIDGLLTQGLPGWGKLFLFIAVSAAALGLIICVFGKGYLTLAARQEETLRRVNEGRRKDNRRERKRTPLQALLRQEMREVITVPAYATNCLTGVVLFPMMIIIMLVTLQGEFPGADMMMELSRLIPRDFYLAIGIGVMCLVNVMGMTVSTAVSREGKRHDMRKTYPLAGTTHLLAKIIMGMLFNLITALTTLIALAVMLPHFLGETLVAVVVGQIFNFVWCALALMIDVRRPKLEWKTETEAVKQNMNGMLSMLMGFGMVALLVGVVALCVNVGGTLMAGVAAATLLLVAGAVTAGWLLFRWSSVTYFLQ